jgi:hypothetical protein
VRQEEREHGSYGVGGRYQVITGEDKADCEDLSACCSELLNVCELAITL